MLARRRPYSSNFNLCALTTSPPFVYHSRRLGGAKAFWKHMEDHEVDFVFEQLLKVILTLKQKIKDGTATEEEYFKALALVTQADLKDILPLPNVNRVEEDTQTCEPGLQPSQSAETTGSPEDNFTLTAKGSAVKEVTSPRSTRDPAEAAEAPSRLPFQPHTCSQECLVKRPWSCYKGGNPLNLPLLCHFRRMHAKADLPSKKQDVVYKAPCGRSLRNFEEVQDYLLQTECDFLFLDHFSFNTYVQVFRNFPRRKGLVFDYDISKGAEATPVSFCNELDRERLPYFKYRRTSWPRGVFLNNLSSTFLASCDCTDGCRDETKCACQILTLKSCKENSASPGRESLYGYKYKRLDEPISSGIYECSLACGCDKARCQNRVVQHGLQVQLQVFNTEKKGWGVRCLDNIDKGTFVCRLMSRAEPRPEEGAKEKNTESPDPRNTLSSKKRKVDSLCSDSEIEFVQTSKDTAGGKHKVSSAEAGDPPDGTRSCDCIGRNDERMKRPQTRTSVLQRCRRQLAIADATSSEEESPVCHRSARRRLIMETRKGNQKQSTQGEFRGPATTRLSEGNAACPDGNPLSDPSLSSTPVRQDEGSVKEENTDLFSTDSVPKGENRSSRQEPAHLEAAEEKESYMRQFSGEDLCLLDATEEGNVGRFLNHSCCPNLFVQSVFVESHDKNFPWIAFFTNRHVKPGTELTWDYGYLPGSIPETEIPCQCGSRQCRRKIL
ncbi:histone-lysine N-methyltransferase SETDB2 isoform X2 [Sphaerodactylus townsendi]|uniref:histone-lysine N-methyltransferase SETDB2 isoform X2 n=1 Tax=Sphaerodactylus townsendi TaxID=933632 RepID=UPI002026877F|nr:histone-lysine N-methyltransferase SETDB2 isoform X2 [Sphaerodactylus townsendi]